MKSNKLTIIFSVLFLSITVQTLAVENEMEIFLYEVDVIKDSSKTAADQTNPAWVIQQIFEAAKTGDYSVLNTICDTVAEIDGDTQRICAVDGSSDDNKKQFSNYFKLGKIVGDVEINGNEASVPITFGPTGDKKETMNLIKRGNNWFLTRF